MLFMLAVAHNDWKIYRWQIRATHENYLYTAQMVLCLAGCPLCRMWRARVRACSIIRVHLLRHHIYIQ